MTLKFVVIPAEAGLESAFFFSAFEEVFHLRDLRFIILHLCDYIQQFRFLIDPHSRGFFLEFTGRDLQSEFLGGQAVSQAFASGAGEADCDGSQGGPVSCDLREGHAVSSASIRPHVCYVNRKGTRN